MQGRSQQGRALVRGGVGALGGVRRRVAGAGLRDDGEPHAYVLALTSHHDGLYRWLAQTGGDVKLQDVRAVTGSAGAWSAENAVLLDNLHRDSGRHGALDYAFKPLPRSTGGGPSLSGCPARPARSQPPCGTWRRGLLSWS